MFLNKCLEKKILILKKNFESCNKSIWTDKFFVMNSEKEGATVNRELKRCSSGGGEREKSVVELLEMLHHVLCIISAVGLCDVQQSGGCGHSYTTTTRDVCVRL